MRGFRVWGFCVLQGSIRVPLYFYGGLRFYRDSTRALHGLGFRVPFILKGLVVTRVSSGSFRPAMGLSLAASFAGASGDVGFLFSCDSWGFRLRK